MSRKKKKGQQERRAQEKARRIEAASKPKEKQQPAPPKKKKEKPARQAVENTAPVQPQEQTRPAPKARTKRPAAPAPVHVSNSRYKALDFGQGRDAGGDCSQYDVRFPARMDIQALFDAIRRERRDEHGTVYISTNLAEAGTSNYQLSYDYAGGMFTRREKLSENKKAPLLADLLGLPVCKLRACGGWGVMDYFVNLVASAGTDAEPYDPSEAIRNMQE